LSSRTAGYRTRPPRAPPAVNWGTARLGIAVLRIKTSNVIGACLPSPAARYRTRTIIVHGGVQSTINRSLATAAASTPTTPTTPAVAPAARRRRSYTVRASSSRTYFVNTDTAITCQIATLILRRWTMYPIVIWTRITGASATKYTAGTAHSSVITYISGSTLPGSAFGRVCFGG